MTRFTRRESVLLAAAAAVVLTAGCSGLRKLHIVVDPPDAFVSVDKQNLGQSPVSYDYDLDVTRSFSVTADKEGYFPESVVINESHRAHESGELMLTLRANPAWSETTTSRATNTWLRVQVDPSIQKDASWQKIIDAVTSAYDSLEQMDPTSGYIRSTMQQRKWDLGSVQGVYCVRTQLLAAIASTNPLVYKFKIKSEFKWGSSRDWEPYDRVFKKDAELIEELNSRLGLK